MFKNNIQVELAIVNATLRTLNASVLAQDSAMKELMTTISGSKGGLVNQISKLEDRMSDIPEQLKIYNKEIAELKTTTENLLARAVLVNKFLAVIITGTITLSLPNILKTIFNFTSLNAISYDTKADISSGPRAAAASTLSKASR